MFLAMRFHELSFVASIVAVSFLTGCGSDDSSATNVAEAGVDATADGGHDGGGCPFGCTIPDGGDDGSGDSASDAKLTCTQLKSQIDMLGNVARACNPSLSQQCIGSTNGICCPISVSPGDPAPVENYDQAVAAYKANCGPVDCSTTMCPTNVPSNACDAPMGSSSGLCE